MKIYFENACKILKSIVLFGVGSSIYNLNRILLFNIKYKYCDSIKEFVLLLAYQNINQGLWAMVLLSAQDYYK